MSAPNGTGRGKKRPRRFHHGRKTGREGAEALARLEAAERRARTAGDAMRSVGARYHEDIGAVSRIEAA